MYMVHKHTCMSCAISISVCMIVSDTVTDTLCYVVFATTFLHSRQRLEVMWRRRRRPSLGPGPSVSGEGNLQLLPLPRSVRGGGGGGREGGRGGRKMQRGTEMHFIVPLPHIHTHTHNTHTHRQTLFFYPSNILPPISLSHCSPRRRSNSRLNSQSVSTMSSQSTSKASMTGENMVCVYMYSIQCIYIYTKAGTSHLCDGSTHSSGCMVNGSNA